MVTLVGVYPGVRHLGGILLYVEVFLSNGGLSGG